jgi:succinoglycan biosynthesis protein ExoL
MNYDYLKVLCVLPVVGHPRDSKRIAMLQEAGLMVEAAAFERDYYPGRLPPCPFESLGWITHSRYLRRILKFMVSLPKLRRAIGRNHIVYASGPDMAYMALVAGLGLGKPVILEVGDIREVQVAPGLKGSLVRGAEKYLVDCCSLLVATAPGFIDYYYRRRLKASIPAMVIENKLEAPSSIEVDPGWNKSSLDGSPLVDRPLRIGYFGLLRCKWSWNVLEALAIARPRDMEIVLAGYSMNIPDLPGRAAKLDNVEFLGKFNSPRDLPALYENVDLVWGCYPRPGPEDWNWRWARTNRFYESCFFQKPIIALEGSGDAAEVERYDIGPIVPNRSVEEAVDEISKISRDDISRWQGNISRLPPRIYLYTTETDELGDFMKKIADDHFAHAGGTRDG